MVKVCIILEPALEPQAGTLSAPQCRALAKVYARWSHQLRIKAAILDRVNGPKPKPKIPILPRRKLHWN